MSSRGKALAGLLVLAALTFSATLPANASVGAHLEKCGKVRRLGVEVLVSKVSCGKALRIAQRSGSSRGAPTSEFPSLEAPGERGLEGPSGVDRAAELLANRSCGSVVVQGAVTYRLSVEKGYSACGTVRRIAEKYGHPISGKPRFFCGNTSYECEYSIYPEGWRCGGLFQGTFQCWHGANSPVRASEVFAGSEDPSARPLMREADRRLLASGVGIFTAKGSKGRLAACDMYIPESRKRGVLCVSAIAGNPGHFREAMLLANGRVRICSDTTECGWVFDDPDPGPTFRPGHVVKDPPFRCWVLSRTVRCTVIASGRGFLINSQEAREIGPRSGS